MADKLLIVMVNGDLTKPAELTAPLFQATAAAAMEYDVEVVLTGGCGELATSGVAERLKVKEGGDRTIYDVMRDAHQAGVRFKVCTPTHDFGNEGLIPEITDTVGGAYVVSEAMDDDTVTLTY